MTTNTVDPIKLEKQNSLKNLTVEQKDQYIRRLLNEVRCKTDSELTIGNEENFNVAIFIGDAEHINKMIIDMMIPCLNAYIESELNDTPRSYNRNLIMFEADSNVDRLVIRWAK